MFYQIQIYDDTNTCVKTLINSDLGQLIDAAHNYISDIIEITHVKVYHFNAVQLDEKEVEELLCQRSTDTF